MRSRRPADLRLQAGEERRGGILVLPGHLDEAEDCTASTASMLGATHAA